MIRKPVLCVLTSALAAVSLYSSPVTAINQAKAADLAASKQQAAETAPVPVQVAKGIQQLVRLLPELSNRYAVYGGDVDGPGVSGVSVAFATSAKDQATATDRAIFDPATGHLLMLDLQPKTSEKPVPLSDQQAKAKASAFVAGLQSEGSAYQPREVTHDQSKTTVRLVRTWNNVALDDAYDVFVTLDETGRIIGFRTFDGRLYETISLTALPSSQRVISAEQAVMRYAESRPLELVYLLPGQYGVTDSVQAKLAYVMKNGVIHRPGSALDALSGKPLGDQSSGEEQSAQIISINGTGEKWAAQSEAQAKDLVRKLVRVEPGKLPFATFTEADDNGQERRFFVWGHFSEGTSDHDKQYSIGLIPDGVSEKERLQLLLTTDAKTGQLLGLEMSNGEAANAKADKKRDWATAEAALKRLLPSGTNQLRIRDAGNEELTLLTVDPMVNGIPVYQDGQTEEQGMYTIQLDAATGNVREIRINRPAEIAAPSTAKALSEQAAVDRLLKAFPLELTYIHHADPQTGEIIWRLGYGVSFRQTKANCFCGAPDKVDLTVHVDAVTGEVIVKE